MPAEDELANLDRESSLGVQQEETDLEKRYDEINVKTMYDMLEQVGDQKLFFLTNRQAELLSESESSVDNLLRALDMTHEPKLLIVLQPEMGFTSHNSCFETPVNWGMQQGMEYQRGPYANDQEDRDTVARLDRFMLEVMIPLAEYEIRLEPAAADTCAARARARGLKRAASIPAPRRRTNALVVLSGLQHTALSSSFNRMLKLSMPR